MSLDPSRVRAVLFDLDGVLVDSYEVWFHLMNDVAKTLGAGSISRPVFRESWGQGIVADVDRFFPMLDVEALERIYGERFGDHLEHLAVAEDVATVFAALRRSGRRVAVITNTPAPMAHQLVSRTGVAPDVLVGGTDVPRPKPAPDMVERACALLGVEPAEGLVVGDSRYDREAARAAGVPYVGLCSEGDVRVERLAALLELLGIA